MLVLGENGPKIRPIIQLVKHFRIIHGTYTWRPVQHVHLKCLWPKALSSMSCTTSVFFQSAVVGAEGGSHDRSKHRKFEVPAANDWIPVEEINDVRVISFSFGCLLCLSQDTSRQAAQRTVYHSKMRLDSQGTNQSIGLSPYSIVYRSIIRDLSHRTRHDAMMSVPRTRSQLHEYVVRISIKQNHIIYLYYVSPLPGPQPRQPMVSTLHCRLEVGVKRLVADLLVLDNSPDVNK